MKGLELQYEDQVSEVITYTQVPQSTGRAFSSCIWKAHVLPSAEMEGC